MLNETVASLIDLRYQAKNAHWNCKGVLFYEFHLLFDRMYDEYEGIIDRLAERFVGQGGKISGTIRQASSVSQIEEQADNEIALKYAQDLVNKIESLKVFNLANITKCNEQNDQVTLNMLCEAGEILDSHLFLLKSSLRYVE